MVPIHIIVLVCPADSKTASRANEKSWEASSKPSSAQVFDRDDRNMWYLSEDRVRSIFGSNIGVFSFVILNSLQTNNALVPLINSLRQTFCML